MQSSVIQTSGSASTTEFVMSISYLLKSFTDPGRSRRAGIQNLVYGIGHMQNAIHKDIIRFEFVTPDSFYVIIDVDLRAVDRPYIDDLIEGLKENLERQRKERALELNMINIAIKEAVKDEQVPLTARSPAIVTGNSGGGHDPKHGAVITTIGTVH